MLDYLYIYTHSLTRILINHNHIQMQTQLYDHNDFDVNIQSPYTTPDLGVSPSPVIVPHAPESTLLLSY